MIEPVEIKKSFISPCSQVTLQSFLTRSYYEKVNIELIDEKVLTNRDTSETDYLCVCVREIKVRNANFS